MKIYYAHNMAIYNTPQEKRDVDMLQALGFEVVNHNSQEHVDHVESMISIGQKERIMDYFCELAGQCDAVAFRALPDGAIPAGVIKEIGVAEALHKPIIELPSQILRRGLSVEQTREHLTEIGQR